MFLWSQQVNHSETLSCVCTGPTSSVPSACHKDAFLIQPKRQHPQQTKSQLYILAGSAKRQVSRPLQSRGFWETLALACFWGGAPCQLLSGGANCTSPCWPGATHFQLPHRGSVALSYFCSMRAAWSSSLSRLISSIRQGAREPEKALPTVHCSKWLSRHPGSPAK